MPKNKDYERALQVLNRMIDLARSGRAIHLSGDPFGGDELTVTVGTNGLNHHHLSGYGSRSGLIDNLGDALEHLSKEEP